MSKVTPRHRDAGQVHVTRSTERFGTPAFMSPEQLRSATTVDSRADIWALGVVLFELVTQSLPFDGEDLPQLCTSILMEEPKRPSALLPDIAPRLEAAILKCLEKDRRFRFRNVAELAQELVPFGPPGAAERVERIKTTVAQGGASIRPPAAVSGSQPIAEPADGAASSAEPAASRAADPSVRRPPTRLRKPLIIGAACAAVIGVAAAWLVESHRGSARPVPGPTATALPAPRETQSAAVPGPTAVTTAADAVKVDAAATPAPASPDAAATTSVGRASTAGSRVTAARASSAQPSAAATPSSSAGDRRSLYGARQ